MPQSNAKKYKGREEVIKRDMLQLGLLPSMRLHGAKDIIGWTKYAEELTGNANLPLVNRAYNTSLEELADNIVAAFIRKVMMQAELIDQLLKEKAEHEQVKTDRQYQAKLQGIQLLSALTE